MEDASHHGKNDNPGVTVLRVTDYLYSKVIPKHLRTPAKTSARQTTSRDKPTKKTEREEVDYCVEASVSTDDVRGRKRLQGVQDTFKSLLRLPGSKERTSSMQDVRGPCAGDEADVKSKMPGSRRKTRTQSSCELRYSTGFSPTVEPDPSSAQAASSFEFNNSDGDDSSKDDGYCGLKEVSSASAEISRAWWMSERHVSREDWCPISLREGRSSEFGSGSEKLPCGEVAEDLAHNQRQLLAVSKSGNDDSEEQSCVKSIEESPTLSQSCSESDQSQAGKKDSITVLDGCKLAFPDIVRYVTMNQNSSTVGGSQDYILSAETMDDGSLGQWTEANSDTTSEGPRERLMAYSENESCSRLHSNALTEDHSAFSSGNEECIPAASLRTPVQKSEEQVQDSRSVNVLKTCSVCLLPSPDLTLMQCFHLVCTACMITSEDETIRCGVCKAEQAIPQDGIVLIKDMFPGLFVTPSINESSAQVFGGSQESVSSDQQPEFSEALPVTIPSEHGTICPIAPSTSASACSEMQSEDGDCGFRKGPATDNWENQTLKEIKSLNINSQLEKAPGTDGEFMVCCDQNIGQNFDDHSDLDSSCNSSPSSGSYILDHAAITEKGSSSSRTIQAKAEQSKQTCGACQGEARTEHVCVTCGGIPLCPGCHTAHLNLPVTRSHEVVPRCLSTSPLPPLTLLSHHQPTCPRHGQDLALMCSTCSVFLCHRCLTPQHTHHVVHELGSVFHAGRKRFSSLQRSIKQHVLAARSATKDIKQQLGRVRKTRRETCDAIKTTFQRHVKCLTSEARGLSDHVNSMCEARRVALSKAERNATRVREEGDSLRCLMNAVSEDTPHLTRLILQSNCQVRFEQLRQQALLCTDDLAGDDMVFRADVLLSDRMAGDSPLGTVCSLASSVPDSGFKVMAILRTAGEVNAIAATPFNELVCVSSTHNLCQVWSENGALLIDVSRHVTRPSDVQVTPKGVMVVLGVDATASASRGPRAGSLTFLSPGGSVLGRLALPSDVHLTHIHCPCESRVLVSDTKKQRITLYAVEGLCSPQGPRASPVRQFSHPAALPHPRHVSEILTGDWLINDRGSYMKLVSCEGQVSTVLTEDEPEAATQPPRSARRESCYYSDRFLTSVCCDSKGRMMAADCGKNGLYMITSFDCGTSGRGERRFISLQELASACHVTCMAVDRQDRIIVGMSDGCVYVLKMNPQRDVL